MTTLGIWTEWPPDIPWANQGMTRLLGFLIEGAASRGDLTVARAAMRAFHMLEHPTDWTKRGPILARILKTWATPKALKRGLYPPKAGPERAEMMKALGIAA